jgi:hypothetical protein
MKTEKCELCGEMVDYKSMGFGVCIDCCEKAVEQAKKIKNGEPLSGMVDEYNKALSSGLDAPGAWNCALIYLSEWMKGLIS